MLGPEHGLYVRALRGGLLKPLAEWVSSSIQLLVHPTTFIPSVDRRPLQGAALTTTTRKHVEFAASSVFVALLVFQLVARRVPSSSQWNSLVESLPISLLIVSVWLIWALLVAFILMILRGTRSAEINVVFGIRVLATVYVLATVIGTLAFLVLGSRWHTFAWSETIASSLAYTVYVPLVFVGANEIRGWRLVAFAALFLLVSAGKTTVDIGFLSSNVGLPSINAPVVSEKEYSKDLGNLEVMPELWSEWPWGGLPRWRWFDETPDVTVKLRTGAEGIWPFRRNLILGSAMCPHSLPVVFFMKSDDDNSARQLPILYVLEKGAAKWRDIG